MLHVGVRAVPHNVNIHSFLTFSLKMSDRELIAGCASDVLVSFAESLHIYTGLLTVATVCGGLSGIVAAALLYVFLLKPLLLTRQVSKCNSSLPRRSKSSSLFYSLIVYIQSVKSVELVSSR